MAFVKASYVTGTQEGGKEMRKGARQVGGEYGMREGGRECWRVGRR